MFFVGCYERTPLNIVLCGRDNTNEVGAVRNFHIAKCLVQHGASPNYRVPKVIKHGQNFPKIASVLNNVKVCANDPLVFVCNFYVIDIETGFACVFTVFINIICNC